VVAYTLLITFREQQLSRAAKAAMAENL
jgi:hypothetical protein